MNEKKNDHPGHHEKTRERQDKSFEQGQHKKSEYLKAKQLVQANKKPDVSVNKTGSSKEPP